MNGDEATLSPFPSADEEQDFSQGEHEELQTEMPASVGSQYHTSQDLFQAHRALLAHIVVSVETHPDLYRWESGTSTAGAHPETTRLPTAEESGKAGWEDPSQGGQLAKGLPAQRSKKTGHEIPNHRV